MYRLPAILLGLTVLAHAAGYAGPAATTAPADEGADVSRAVLRPWAFTSTSTYVLGEPVYVHIVLSNASADRTFEVSGSWNLASDFEVMIARAGELPRRFTAGLTDRLRPGATYRIEPRSLVAQRWTLCYDPDRPTGFAFDKPGVYTIRLTVRVSVDKYPQDLNLGTLPRIEIKEPSAEQKKVLDLILRPECASDLQRLRADDATADIWRRVAREHPNSLWAPHARLLLAWHAWTKDTTDFGKLAGEFESIVREYPGFVLADEVCYGIAASYDRAGQTRKALEWLNRLRADHPKSRRIREGDALFQKYIYRGQWDSRYAPWYLKQ